VTPGDRGGEPRNIDPFAKDPGRPGGLEGAGGFQPEPLRRPPDFEDEDDERGGFLSFMRELPVLLLIAFGLAFLLRTFVIQVFYIPSSSMEDTLEINDRIVVEKLSYRFREPKRGEIIVFEGEETVPADNGAVGKVIRTVGQFIGIVPVNAQDFVKRVIGLPGDHVEITDGQVLVNGVAIDEPYVDFEDLRSSGPFDVPEGMLFVLGDNRPNSSDSRFGLGYIAIDDVVGRAFVTIWPFSRLGTHGTPDYGDIPDVEPSPVDQPTPSEAPTS